MSERAQARRSTLKCAPESKQKHAPVKLTARRDQNKNMERRSRGVRARLVNKKHAKTPTSEA